MADLFLNDVTLKAKIYYSKFLPLQRREPVRRFFLDFFIIIITFFLYILLHSEAFGIAVNFHLFIW